MQGRSKRFHAGEAAPQPTRASIYQEENTPLDWTAAHELHAQLALPRRPAELHPRALRHGLIASQLGLPMLARAEKKLALEEWEQAAAWPEPAHAAYSGEAEPAGLDWPSSEQTTRYDEWELQKELVTYEDTYPGYDAGYDEHPRLDFQLPPLAAAGYDAEPDQRHELDYAQAAYAPAEYEQEHASSPGSYPYTHSTQPSAARWQSEQPIRRVQAAHPPRAQQAQPAQPLNTTPQSNFAAHHATNARHAAQPQSTRRGATSPNEPRTATQTSFAAPNTHCAAQAPGPRTLSATQRGAANANEPRTATQTSFAPHAPHTAPNPVYAAPAPGAGSLGFAPHAPHTAPNAHYAAQAHGGRELPVHRGVAAHAQARAGVAAHVASAANAQAAATGQRPVALAGASALSRAARHYVDEEPVVYPRGGGWLKRLLLLAALAGGAYAGQHYYFNNVQRAPASIPAPPPPAAPVEPPAQPAATAEPSEAPAPSAPPTPESTKERRSAARAERWRERHARRGRDDDGADDQRDYASTRNRTTRSDSERSSASAHDDYVNDRHAAAQSGTLRINSLPWSQVHIDGQLVGHTPQMNLLLPAGKHRVTLVNHEMHLSKTLTVQITPGNVTSHTVNLAE